MKRLLIVATLLLIGIAQPASAANLSYSSFASDITVQTDTSITVQETVVVDFLSPLHGIFRNIPYEYKKTDGDMALMPIDQVAVTVDGAAVSATQSRSGGELTLKIGDPNRTISGRHTYVISYRVQAATNFFSDHDELYWNITGHSWDQPLTNVSAIVHVPAGVASADIRHACFTGAVGSTTTDCTSAVSDSTATFASSDFLTVVVGWPVGMVTKPADYDSLRAQGPTFGINSLPHFPFWLSWVLSVALPLGAFVLMFRRWQSHGRDPRGQGTIIVQYEPPAGLTPAELGVILDEKASDRDVTSTIIDLAVRGWLTITEIVKPGLLGFGGGKDYQLDLKKPISDDLRPHERDLLRGLFGTSAVSSFLSSPGGTIASLIQNAAQGKLSSTADTTAVGASVTLSTLKGTFADDVAAIKTDLYRSVAGLGYFAANPRTTIWKYVGLGIAVAVVLSPLALFGAVGAPLAGVVVLCFAGVMPARTAKGVAAREHALGFKDYLATAEKYRIQWQEKEHIFETYLPYAMVFGVADKWSKALASLATKPPDWYHGSQPGMFNSLVLWSALNSFQSASVKSFAPPAASGGSGFGGGGFSGGGGGGGGGGGW